MLGDGFNIGCGASSVQLMEEEVEDDNSGSNILEQEVLVLFEAMPMSLLISTKE